MTQSLSRQELRSFLVRYHYLDSGGRLSGKAGMKKLLRRIGCVQYDPLNVVGRNPDLVFQSRIRDYNPALLDDLLYRERSLIDGWDKEMSIYLSADWPCFSRVRRVVTEMSKRTLRHRNQTEALSYLPQIKEEIRKRGPLSAREIKLGACEGGRWGHRQISGAAMDYLWTAGELGIYKKKNAQKIYAFIDDLLSEKILSAPDPFSGDDEFFEWYFYRRIGSLGAHWLRNGGGWLGSFMNDTALRQKIFAVLEEKKHIVPVRLDEINETFYIRKKDFHLLNEKSEYDGAAKILAPLDNMLWDRLMVKKVFDFEYSWEVYVPEKKRKYGYYVLPVLYRDNLIARFEPLHYVKGQPLAIKNWWWEKGLKVNSEIKQAVKQGLENFAAYLGAEGMDKKNPAFPNHRRSERN